MSTVNFIQSPSQIQYLIDADDALLEKTGVGVEDGFAAGGLLEDHGGKVGLDVAKGFVGGMW